MLFISKLIPCLKSQDYKALPKKDDDLGIKEVNDWISNTPLQPDIRGYDHREIKKCARLIIKKLYNVHISPYNLETIKNHLIELAQQSDLLREGLIDYMPKIKANKETIQQLQVDLNGIDAD